MVKTQILPFAFGCIFIMMIFGLYLHNKFLVLLSRRHPGVWKKLGSPKLFSNNSIKGNLRILAFLKNKQYSELNDPQLTKISQFLWNYNIIYFLTFGLVVVLFIINLNN